jgi:hypothetical protein
MPMLVAWFLVALALPDEDLHSLSKHDQDKLPDSTEVLDRNKDPVDGILESTPREPEGANTPSDHRGSGIDDIIEEARQRMGDQFPDRFPRPPSFENPEHNSDEGTSDHQHLSFEKPTDIGPASRDRSLAEPITPRHQEDTPRSIPDRNSESSIDSRPKVEDLGHGHSEQSDSDGRYRSEILDGVEHHDDPLRIDPFWRKEHGEDQHREPRFERRRNAGGAIEAFAQKEEGSTLKRVRHEIQPNEEFADHGQRLKLERRPEEHIDRGRIPNLERIDGEWKPRRDFADERERLNRERRLGEGVVDPDRVTGNEPQLNLASVDNKEKFGHVQRPTVDLIDPERRLKSERIDNEGSPDLESPEHERTLNEERVKRPIAELPPHPAPVRAYRIHDDRRPNHEQFDFDHQRNRPIRGESIVDQERPNPDPHYPSMHETGAGESIAHDVDKKPDSLDGEHRQKRLSHFHEQRPTPESHIPEGGETSGSIEDEVRRKHLSDLRDGLRVPESHVRKRDIPLGSIEDEHRRGHFSVHNPESVSREGGFPPEPPEPPKLPQERNADPPDPEVSPRQAPFVPEHGRKPESVENEGSWKEFPGQNPELDRRPAFPGIRRPISDHERSRLAFLKAQGRPKHDQVAPDGESKLDSAESGRSQPTDSEKVPEDRSDGHKSSPDHTRAAGDEPERIARGRSIVQEELHEREKTPESLVSGDEQRSKSIEYERRRKHLSDPAGLHNRESIISEGERPPGHIFDLRNRDPDREVAIPKVER